MTEAAGGTSNEVAVLQERVQTLLTDRCTGCHHAPRPNDGPSAGRTLLDVATKLVGSWIYTAILNNMEDGIVACDESGILSVFNRATREFHGVPEQPIPPEQWAEHYGLYMADGKTPLRTEDIPLYRAFQGESVRNFEIVIAPKTARARRLLATGQPILDSQGHKLGAMVSMHDVTAQRKAEEEVELQICVQEIETALLNLVANAIGATTTRWQDSRWGGGEGTRRVSGVRAAGRRQRIWHRRGRAPSDLRSFLHDQTPWRGDRSWAFDDAEDHRIAWWDDSRREQVG